MIFPDFLSGFRKTDPRPANQNRSQPSKMTSTTTAIEMPTSLHFIKTIREVRVYPVRHELTYADFVCNYMTKLDGESDENFKTRCVEVWDGLCSKIRNDKDEDGAIDLGEDEKEVDVEDEWDGDVKDEVECDIADLVDRYDNRPITTAAR